jgi:uncharacterized protein YehS (DUF1456 family)
MAEIFSHSGYSISEGDILDLLKKEEEEGYTVCSDKLLCLFLDGLVIHKRGRKEGEIPASVTPSSRLTNNDILKKVRVSLNFKDEDMMEIFRLAEFDLSKSELSALFRKKDNKNFKLCKDQLMKAFLSGLTIKYRK